MNQRTPSRQKPSVFVSFVLIVAALTTIATSEDDRSLPMLVDAGTVDAAQINDAAPEPADGATDPDGAANAPADAAADAGQQAEDSGAIVEADSGAIGTVDAGVNGPQITLSNLPEECETAGLLAPALPAEAGHYVATILTPNVYPFAVEGIRYVLLRNDEFASCDGGVAHRVLLFALDADGPLPENPAATGLGYRQYDVPAAPDALEGRQVEVTVPIPLILTEGQRVAVAIQFAVDGARHICVGTCELDGPQAGLDWWSNASEVPFQWQDLVTDFNLDLQVMTRLVGSQVQ